MSWVWCGVCVCGPQFASDSDQSAWVRGAWGGSVTASVSERLGLLFVERGRFCSYQTTHSSLPLNPHAYRNNRLLTGARRRSRAPNT